MGLTERIIEVRERKGFSQSIVAEQLNIERQNYSRIEKRGNKLSIEQLNAIANALDVTLAELLGLDAPVENTERIKDLEERNKYLSSLDEFAVKGLAYDIIRFYRVNTPEHLDHPLYEDIEQSPYCRLRQDDETKEKILHYIKFKEKESYLYFFVSTLLSFQEIAEMMNSWDVIYDHRNISQHVKKKYEEADMLFRKAANSLK